MDYQVCIKMEYISFYPLTSMDKHQIGSVYSGCKAKAIYECAGRDSTPSVLSPYV